MALENRDYEKAIFDTPAGVGNNTDDTHIKAGVGKETIIENNAGQPIAEFKDDKSSTFNGDTTTKGNNTVEGTTTLKGATVTEGAVTNKENVTAEKNVSVGQNLSVAGNTTIGDSGADTLEVKGTSTFRENTAMDKNLTVNGTSNLQATTVNGALDAKENATMEKDVLVRGNTILGDASTDTVTVNGTPIFKENVSMEKNLSVTGDFSVSGAFNPASLGTTGNTVLGDASSDTLLVKATPTFKEYTTFEKAVKVTAQLETGSIVNKGNTTLGDSASDTVTVNATPTFKENVTMEKNLSVAGDFSVAGAFNPASLGTTGNTVLGDASSDTLTVNATSTFKENVTMDKDLNVKGNTTLGDNASDTLTVNATPTFKTGITVGQAVGDISNFNGAVKFKEDIQAYKKLYMGSSGNEWMIGTAGNLSMYLGGAKEVEFLKRSVNPDAVDHDRGLVGIESNLKGMTDVPAQFVETCTVLGETNKTINTAYIFSEIQGNHMIMSWNMVINNLSTAIPTHNDTNITLKLDAFWADSTTPSIASHTNIYGAGMMIVYNSGNTNRSVATSCIVTCANNRLIIQGLDILAGERGAFTADNAVFYGQIALRVAFN